MKATLMEFPYIVDTGDECKRYRPRTLKVKAILFEDGEQRVIFLPGRYRASGEFFRLTGLEEDGRPKLEGPYWDYRTPDGPPTSVQDLAFTDDQVRAALTIPGLRELIQAMKERCDEYVKTNE